MHEYLAFCIFQTILWATQLYFHIFTFRSKIKTNPSNAMKPVKSGVTFSSIVFGLYKRYTSCLSNTFNKWRIQIKCSPYQLPSLRLPAFSFLQVCLALCLSHFAILFCRKLNNLRTQCNTIYKFACLTLNGN